MSTMSQWPVWKCPHCGETWHSGREYCVTCKHGMVQMETGQWVPVVSLPLAEAQARMNEVHNRAVDEATAAMKGMTQNASGQWIAGGALPLNPPSAGREEATGARPVPAAVVPDGEGSPSASPPPPPMSQGEHVHAALRDVGAQAAHSIQLGYEARAATHDQARVTGLPPEPWASFLKDAMSEANRLRQDTALREDRIRRVESELNTAQEYAKERTQRVAALEREYEAYLQRAEQAEKRLAEYEEQVYLWCKPLLMALRDEGVPVSLDTVIPVTVERLRHPPLALNVTSETTVPATPDVLAMLAQLELRMQQLEARVPARHVHHTIPPDLTNGPFVYPPQQQRPLTQQEGAGQGPPSYESLRNMTGPPEHYPTWILTDAMQARLERDLIQEQTLRGGPAYGGTVQR